MYSDLEKLHQGTNRKSWIQESNTDAVFDKLVALSEKENGPVLQNTSRDTVYDIVTSGEEDFLDNSNRNGKMKTVRGRKTRENARNEEQGRINETHVLLHKRNLFKTRTSGLDEGRKKAKLDFCYEFGSHSRSAASHETSNASQNSRGRRKHNVQMFYCPMVISDVSSDEDDTLYGKKLDKRRINNYCTTYDPEKELANQMHRKIFHSHKLKPNNYSQRNGHMMSHAPKKIAVKPSLNNIRRISFNHSVKFSFELHTRKSELHRIPSTREESLVQTLQRNKQEQIPHVKNNILSERRTHTEAPVKAIRKGMCNVEVNDSLQKVAHVRKLEIQNQRQRDIEYVRNILENDLPTPDLNSLCTYTENDAQEHPLLSTNLSLAGKEEQRRSREMIRPLPSNEQIALPFNPLGDKSNSETSCTKSPSCIGLTMSHSSPEKMKTSTPLPLQPRGIDFLLSPIMCSENVDRILSGSVNQIEMHADNSNNLSPLIQSDSNHKNHSTMTAVGQKRKNSIYMGFPNPVGTNKCWMNSSLQTIFGMKPFMQDLLNTLKKNNTIESRGKYSSLVETFIKVVKARRRRNQSQLNRNLELLYQSLGVLNEHFTTHSQEDAVEFLTEFFSALREEFNRIMHNNKMHAARPDKCQSQHNSNITNAVKNCQEDESNTYSQLKNPVNKNIIFKLKESHSCMMCCRHSITETEHFTLIVTIPSDTSEGMTLQEALERCMMTETREFKCAQCESRQCRVKTMFTLLPRFLIIHVNRFEMKDNVIKKLHNYVKIPLTLTVKNVMSKTETILPLQWISVSHKRFAWSEEKERSFSSPQNNDEAEEFQHTVQHNVEDPVKNKQEYMLLAIISHKGDTPNCGHYEADVYNVTTRKWNHYNDEVVTSSTEEEVTGISQQENGYAFLYIYKPLFSQLVNECKVPRNCENQ